RAILTDSSDSRFCGCLKGGVPLLNARKKTFVVVWPRLLTTRVNELLTPLRASEHAPLIANGGGFRRPRPTFPDVRKEKPSSCIVSPSRSRESGTATSSRVEVVKECAGNEVAGHACSAEAL